MNIVFGGTFNPPTIAHIEIIKQLLEKFPKANLIIVPVGNDYKKPDLIDYHSRKDMLELATKDLQKITISDIEFNNPFQGTLYTMDKLSEKYSELYYVIGSDNLKYIKTWINWEDLLCCYPFIIFKREGYPIDNKVVDLFMSDSRVLDLDMKEEVSSTNIRKDIELYKRHLNDDVYNYIIQNKLYI